jgi:prevent-host-death family protein
MKIATLADVKTHLSAYIEQCIAEGPIVITRNGKPAVVMVAPIDDEDLENLVLARSRRFQAMLEKSRQSIEEGRGLSEEEFWTAVEQGKPKNH